MGTVEDHLLNYLNTQASIILIQTNEEGIIKHVNNYTEKLAGKSLQGISVCSFFVSFNAKLNLEDILEGKLQNTRLNVNTHRNIPETFYFSSFKTPESVLLIGETNSEETDEMRQNILHLNNELNNIARDLQKKNIKLEQLNELKNQFLGIAAHDLRNPISTIIMLSDFLMDSEDHELSEELCKILEVINKSSEFMLRLLEELLDVVKIESGKLQLNIHKTDIETLLSKNITVNAIVAGKKNINIVLNIPAKLPEVALDEIKIEQVLNNLLSNAIKYSHRNTTVTVSAMSTNDFILISVQDQGQGIPKHELDKVFTPFSKISVRGTEGEKSTGLGLSIVKKIITGHLGRIWLESEQGKGTTFYFTLPIERKSI